MTWVRAKQRKKRHLKNPVFFNSDQLKRLLIAENKINLINIKIDQYVKEKQAKETKGEGNDTGRGNTAD